MRPEVFDQARPKPGVEITRMDDSPDSPPQVPSSSSNNHPEDTSPTRDKPEDDPAAKKSNKAKKRTKTGCLSTYKVFSPFPACIHPLLLRLRESNPVHHQLAESGESNVMKRGRLAETARSPRGTARATTNGSYSKIPSVPLVPLDLSPTPSLPLKPSSGSSSYRQHSRSLRLSLSR